MDTDTDTARSAFVEQLQQAQGGMSLESFAATIGTSKTHLSRFYAGEREIGAYITGAIKMVYGASNPALLTATERYENERIRSRLAKEVAA